MNTSSSERRETFTWDNQSDVVRAALPEYFKYYRFQRQTLHAPRPTARRRTIKYADICTVRRQTPSGVPITVDKADRIIEGCTSILGETVSAYDGEPEGIMFAALVELFDAYAKEIGEREYDFVYQAVRENLDCRS